MKDLSPEVQMAIINHMIAQDKFNNGGGIISAFIIGIVVGCIIGAIATSKTMKRNGR
jgi:uncharacterized membrane protein YciS (DUF1049 family)